MGTAQTFETLTPVNIGKKYTKEGLTEKEYKAEFKRIYGYAMVDLYYEGGE